MSKLAKRFEQDALQQLSAVMEGGEEHVIATTTGIIAGEAVVYGGPPGGNKTNLMRGVPKLIGDLESNQKAEIAPLVDISPKDILGFFVTGQGGVIEYVPGMVTPDTRSLLDDDATRKNPYAQDALLGLRENGYVLTSGGRYDVDLLVDIQTQNAAKPGQPIFKQSDAGAGRNGVGTIFSKTSEEVMTSIFGRGFTPGEITPITDIETIEAIKKEAREVRFSDSLDRKGGDMAAQIRDANETVLRFTEAGGRLARQLGNLTAARLVLSNEKGSATGEMEALEAAAGMIIDARVSGLSANPEEDARSIRRMVGIETEF